MKNQHDLQEGMNLEEQILKVLSDKPGQKASEIAIIFEVDKRQINSILYGNLKNKCSQDEKYYWYLNEDAPAYKKTEKKTISKTALSNLSHYYLSCLGQDDEGGISVFADNKYGDLDYTELGKLPLNENEPLFESKEAQGLLGKIRKDRSRLEMYFGYPTTTL